MIIYVLKHKNSDFSGLFFGVGFEKGRGSTSSKFDRDRCVKNGCKDISQQIEASRAAKRKKAEDAAAKEYKAKLKTEKEAEKKAAKEEKIEEPEKEEK